MSRGRARRPGAPPASRFDRRRSRSGNLVGALARLGGVRLVSLADCADESADLLPEEEGDRDEACDDRLDDQAAGSWIDIREEVMHSGLQSCPPVCSDGGWVTRVSTVR